MKELEAIKNIPKVNYRFVDDTRLLVRGVKDGWAWEDGKMVFSKEKEEEDKKSKDSLAQKTAKEFRKILDSFSPELKSTTETCDDFENGRCATLDFECWLEDDGKGGQKILYSYFEKLVSKKTAIMKKSALGENMKISSLTQEVIRRMKNTSLDVDMKERISIINKYHKRLQRSGYELQQIKKIISAGLLGWERIKKIAAESGGNINRSASETFIKRNTNRLLGKSTWYRRKKNKKEDKKVGKKVYKKKREEKKDEKLRVKSVIMVPKTKDSLLAKSMQEMEKKLSCITKEKVKIQEVGSVSIRQLLVSSDVWGGQPCSRDHCLCCANPKEKKQNCFKPSILYEISCYSCLQLQKNQNDNIDDKVTGEAQGEGEDGDKAKEGEKPKPRPKPRTIKYAYTGHSSLSAYQRCKGHMKMYFDQHEGSALNNHAKDKHEGEDKPQYVMKILKYWDSTFRRLIHEGVRLHRESQKEDVVVLNSRSERADLYMIPRLSLMLRPPDPGLEPDDKKEGQGVVAAPPPPVIEGQKAIDKSLNKVPTNNSIPTSKNSKGEKAKSKFKKTWLDEVRRRSKGD